jgi:hypothetical protein
VAQIADAEVRHASMYTSSILRASCILVCWISVVVRFKQRATAGVSRRSIRKERAYAAAAVTALVGVSVFGGVLTHDARGVVERRRGVLRRGPRI